MNYIDRYPTLERFISPCGNNVSPFLISKKTFETEVFINLKTMWKLVPIVLARDPSLRRLVFIILWLLRVKFWTRYFLHEFPAWFPPRFSFWPEEYGRPLLLIITICNITRIGTQDGKKSCVVFLTPSSSWCFNKTYSILDVHLEYLRPRTNK